MKLLLSILLLLPFASNAQAFPPGDSATSKIFVHAERMPSTKYNLGEYLAKNLRYRRVPAKIILKAGW